MNQNDVSKINNQLKVLIDSQGLTFGRVAAMAWINFKTDNSEYALHLQCCFRIRDNHEILVTNTDMFEPSDLVLNDLKYNPDTFEWDVQGGNKFDEWVKSS